MKHMLSAIALAALLLTCCLDSSGQTFEAASIRPAPDKLDTSNGPVSVGSKGGPGTESPLRYWCNFCEISDLISRAYDVPEYRIVTTKFPRSRFYLAAVLRAGATQDEFKLMLQNLLAERFGLRLHREQRPMRSYRLLVSDGGVKLKPHIDGVPIEPQSEREKAQVGSHYKAHATMASFARVIENAMGQPVVDDTALTGEYDFDLSWRFDDLDTDQRSPSDLPTLRSAIQSAGLKLEGSMAPVEVIVVDAATSPTSN